MGCKGCKRYSFSLQRCLDGKINPSTKKAAVAASNVMGAGYICPMNKWKGAANEVIHNGGNKFM